MSITGTVAAPRAGLDVLVLGASGGIGAELVRQAAAAGHRVTALARRPLEVPSGVRAVVGDVLSASDVDAAVAGQQVVLSALGIRRVNQANPWSPLASPPDLAARSALHIVTAMRRHGVGRVIAVSASGVGDSRPGLNLMMRFFIRYTNVGANYRDLEEMERVYAASGLDWCCVRPVGLADGPVTGRVRETQGFPFGAWISRADVASWMVAHASGELTGRQPIIREVKA